MPRAESRARQDAPVVGRRVAATVSPQLPLLWLPRVSSLPRLSSLLPGAPRATFPAAACRSRPAPRSSARTLQPVTALQHHNTGVEETDPRECERGGFLSIHGLEIVR